MLILFYLKKRAYSPQEMVFDQDSIVCVSENAGDIIYGTVKSYAQIYLQTPAE